MNLNDKIVDSYIRHQILLLKRSQGINNQLLKILNSSEQIIFNKIVTLLDSHSGINNSSLRQIAKVDKFVSQERSKNWSEIETILLAEILALGLQDNDFNLDVYKNTAPVTLDLIKPNKSEINSIINYNPFRGKTLKKWVKSLKATDIAKIQDAVKIGVVQGETSVEIARRVLGTKSQKGRNGVTQITRNNLDAIIKTAINSVSGNVRSLFYQKNSDVLDKEVFVATLDSRTTPICRANDGKIFEIGKGLIPPLHIRCRSLRVAIFDGKVLGERPAKPDSQRQFLREYSNKNLTKLILSRNNLPYGHKGSFDNYQRQRIKQLTNQLPAQTSYQDWLKKQSNDFQDEVLGVTKGKLFRANNLTLDKFIDRKGEELTLKELAKKDKMYFEKAGIDPQQYLQ